MKSDETLHTERLILRSIGEGDRDFIVEEFSNDDVNRFLFDAEPITRLEEANELIEFYTQPEPQLQRRWILVRASDGVKMGTCGYHCLDRAKARCEIGYDLLPAYRGMGYMREALKAVIPYMRDVINVREIDAHIYTGNARSIHLAEKLGFAYSGQDVQYTFHDQSYPHRVYTLECKGYLILEGKDILLRDFIAADIDRRILWETQETEWQLWDGPWVFEALTAEKRRARLRKKIEQWKTQAKQARGAEARDSFQIACKDDPNTCIGWVAAYRVDDDGKRAPDGRRCAVGIDIPDLRARGKGYAYQALCLFISYLFNHGETDICLQTWSGNERMIHVARRIGFEECQRTAGTRHVRGKTYDQLTFCLNRDHFNRFSASLI